jgi:hypothetical protein
MLILTVAALRDDMIPATFLYQFDHVAYFHRLFAKTQFSFVVLICPMVTRILFPRESVCESTF